jgi:hypothetical protein
VSGHGGETFVQFAAELQHLLGVLCDRFLAPNEGHGAQQREQVGGRGQENVVAGGELPPAGVLVFGYVQEHLGRQEHTTNSGVHDSADPISIALSASGSTDNGPHRIRRSHSSNEVPELKQSYKPLWMSPLVGGSPQRTPHRR